MMAVPVKNLLGMAGIPQHRTSAVDWLNRNSVPVVESRGNGGAFHAVRFCDLPPDVRLAYLRRDLDTLELDPGTYDDAAHEALAEASPARRDRAERKAAIVRMLTALRAQGVKEGESFALVHEKFGNKGTSKPSLKRLLKAVQGVDPINYAPALLDDYKATVKRAEFSDEAWQFFLTLIRDAAPEWPLLSAWRDVRDAGRAMDWAVPSYPTFYRRWNELTEAQRLHARQGKAEATKRLTMPALRDKTSIGPLEWVSLDGRTQDFWADWGDGKVSRPVMLALVDVASNMVLDWELAPSENAVATVRLIKRVCERFGIFERLYPDNGSAFAGHLVAGGNVHRFRHGKAKDGAQPFGICHYMGIKLHFALPKNAQAKIAERTFATLSRAVDDRPEFKGAHAGHAPGASPSADVQPVGKVRSVLRREITRHNCEGGRRSQGARGRSYEQVFHDGLAERVMRKPTAHQLYLSGLIWKPVAVDRFGRVHVNGWAYGGPDTQDALLRYHGKGQRILFGRDPDDFSAPAMAYDEDGHKICAGIEPVERGAYGSVDGIRDAARNRKAARVATAQAEAANDYMGKKEFEAAMAALDAQTEAADAPDMPPATDVVKARFGAPLRERKAQEPKSEEVISADMLKNQRKAIAARLARQGKSA